MGGLFGNLFGVRRSTLDGRGSVDPAIDGPYSMSLAGQPGPQAPPIAPDQRMAQAPDPSRRLFGDGHIGGIIGGLGKLLSYGPFAGMAQEGMNRRRDREALDDRYRQSQIDHMGAPQGVPLGNGGFGTWSAAGGLQVLREPEKPDAQPTALERQMEYIKKLNPNLTPQQLADIAQRAMSGYGYSPEAIDAKTQAAIKLKGVPTYGALHPRAPTRAAPKPPAGFILDK